jgi:hypothetical protein
VGILIVAGCGSSDAKTGFKPLSDCEMRLENAAAAKVLRKAFADGKVGTADEVAATYFKGDPRSAWLDASGALRLPATITDSDTHWDYFQWMGHIAGTPDKVSDAMFAARMNARHHSTCKSLTAD